MVELSGMSAFFGINVLLSLLILRINVNIENRTLTKITANRRVEKRLIDPVDLREASVNAIVHNDYTTEEAPVVEIFSDRLTITSFGGLVNGLSQDEFFRGRTLPRNRELMRVFRDMQWVEHLGVGNAPHFESLWFGNFHNQ